MSGDGVAIEPISPDIPGNGTDIAGNTSDMPDIPGKVDGKAGNSEDIQPPAPEITPEPVNITDVEIKKRGRGRPPGAKNKPKPEIPREIAAPRPYGTPPPPRKRKASPVIPTPAEIAPPEKPPSFADAMRQWQQAERFAVRSHYGSMIQGMFS